jgi:hypothetical protein
MDRGIRIPEWIRNVDLKPFGLLVEEKKNSLLLHLISQYSKTEPVGSVADPRHINSDLDPTFHLN